MPGNSEKKNNNRNVISKQASVISRQDSLKKDRKLFRQRPTNSFREQFSSLETSIRPLILVAETLQEVTETALKPKSRKHCSEYLIIKRYPVKFHLTVIDRFLERSVTMVSYLMTSYQNETLPSSDAFFSVIQRDEPAEVWYRRT